MDNFAKDPVVFVKGGFDNLQTRGIRFLQEAAKLGRVHVLLLSDEMFKEKHSIDSKFTVDERRYYLESIRYVDEISVIDQPSSEALPRSFLKKAKISHQPIWTVLASDLQPEEERYCRENNMQIQVIPEESLTGFPIDPARSNENGSAKKKVMVSGCFDWVHTGHIRFFEEAAQFGDLYVVLGHDDNLQLLKGEGHPMFSEEERKYWVGAIRFVKQSLISTGDGWLDAEPEVKRIKPDVFVVNEDGDKPEKRKLFRELGIEYKVLKRKPKPGLPARMSTNLRGF